MFAFSQHNLADANFWYDESGQFWMAKGLNHNSLPYAPTAGLGAVLFNNRQNNLDPGGFTVLLHYWTMISASPLFLRLLPFSFFVLGMVIVSRLTFIWFPKNWLSYFSGFILLWSDLLKHYAFELRAYSMEMCSTLLALYFCHRIPHILQSKRYALLAGVAMAIGITARYSALFPVAALGLIIFYRVIRSFSRKSFIHFLVFLLPIIVSVTAIYLVTLKYQNPAGNSPSYVQSLMIKTGNFSGMISASATQQLIAPLVVVLLAVVLFYSRSLFKQYRYFIAYAVITNVFFISLSLVGKYPWAFNTKWDISTHTIFVLALLPIIFIALELARYINHQLGAIVQVAAIIFFLTFFIVKANTYVYAVNLNNTVYNNFSYYHYKKSMRRDVKILANQEASSTLRYLFEYGPLNSRPDLYSNLSFFVNDHDITHNTSLTLDTINTYDYIVLADSNDGATHLKALLEASPNWVDATEQGPSKLLRNSSRN